MRDMLWIPCGRGKYPSWVTETMSNPGRLEADPGDDQLAHALKTIPEFGGRVLRVICNRDRQPVHVVTAFFDRAMKGKL